MSAGRKLFGEGTPETQYFRSSFRQLSDVQQRQVGLVLGAAVADAAVREWQIRLSLAASVMPPQAASPSEADNSAQDNVQHYKRICLSESDEALLGELFSDETRMEREDAFPSDGDCTVFHSTLETLEERLPLAAAALHSSSSSTVSATAAMDEFTKLSTLIVEGGRQSMSAHRDGVVDVDRTLRHQSFTSLFMRDVVHFLATSHCGKELLHNERSIDSNLQKYLVQPRWAVTAKGHPSAFAALQGSLLHTTAALMPLPCVYPWADDDALRQFSTPFAELLSSLPNGTTAADNKNKIIEKSTNEEASTASYIDTEDGRAEVLEDCAVSTLSVALRCLQSNPNAVKNAGLQAMGRSEPSAQFLTKLFDTSDVPLVTSSSSVLLTQQLNGRGSFEADLTAQREALWIAQRCRNYAHGVRMLVKLELQRAQLFSPPTLTRHQSSNHALNAVLKSGGPVRLCQKAMVLGGILGARFGVRSIPNEWLTATPGHVPLASMAMELSQWAWNPEK